MACRLCERPVRIPQGAGQVLLFSPVTEVQLKALEVVRGWPESFRSEEGTLVSETTDFSGFLDRFLGAGNWSILEQDGLQLLFLPRGTGFTFRSSQETRSLAEWRAVREAEFLATMIENKELVTFFQPIWDLKANRHYGWECLTRGRAPDGALVPPGRLFDAARSSGMTFPLDRLARQTALRSASALQIPGFLFINFLPTAIYDPVFCLRTTTELARELGMDPARIVFEVVESEDVADQPHLRRIVDYYRDQGFRVALDDVGSGYAGLNTLVGLQPNVLKVDIEIIRDIPTTPAKQSVFKVLRSVCQDLGILLLAEGVETDAERQWVSDHGADLAQGYWWGRPEAVPPGIA